MDLGPMHVEPQTRWEARDLCPSLVAVQETPHV